MRRLIAGLALAAGLSLALASCTTPEVALQNLVSRDATKPYLGMTKAEVTACAGMPHSRYDAGDNDILTYHYSGDGPRPGADAKEEKKKKPVLFGGKKKESDKDWECTASLVFENDRLVRVSFAHKEVRSPYQWQSEDDPEKAEEMRKEGVPTCNFSLPNCRR